jgi:hypothetical protein
VPTIFTGDSSLCLNTVEPKIQGSIFFFTVVLAERSSNLLVEQIGRLRQVYRAVQEGRPFDTVAIACLRPIGGGDMKDIQGSFRE